MKLVGNTYGKPSEVPSDFDLHYKCENCGEYIPSIPNDNISCKCGMVYIDRDCHRLIVDDFSKFSVWRSKEKK